jgi:hypothetical protein
MCAEVDAVMLESVDGRPHLAQAKPVLAAGKPLYIDKPVAGSLRDAIEIFRLAEAAHVPVFTASSLRYGRATQAVRAGSIGTVTNAPRRSRASRTRTIPDLYLDGVHGCESLFTVMGTGCRSSPGAGRRRTERSKSSARGAAAGRVSLRRRRQGLRWSRPGHQRRGAGRQFRRLRPARGGNRDIFPDTATTRGGGGKHWSCSRSWRQLMKAAGRTARKSS